jgi:membrane fusion protein (multidrug efflux system)
MSKARLGSVAILLAGIALAACDDSSPTGASAASGPPPPVEVSVVVTAAEDLPVVNELPGRIAPTRIAEVRPRVSGIIVERVFEQGSLVAEGDVLYRIDPAPFRVEVQRAKANLERAEATRLRANQEADRQRALREKRVSSAQQYEDAMAALAQADADVASAEAGLAAAELDLEYTEVRAPIGGRIGRALITEGALVSPDRSESLAVIQQLDPVYADFTQSASELLQLRRALNAGALTSENPGEAVVHLLLDDGTPYPHPGRLLFSEATVDATTGQVILRAEVPNPEGNLLPGMYVRVRIVQGVQDDAIAVPQQAIQRDAGGRAQVYVVKEDGSTELRTVKAGRVVGNRWVIEDGLSAGERVVVEGFQKIRPGAPVSAQAWNTEADPGDAPQETPAAGKAG